MGRQLRRVPLDFDWPRNKVWEGFINPHRSAAIQCMHCAGTGSSPEALRLHSLWYGYTPFKPEDRDSKPYTAETPEVRAFAERNVRRAPEFYGEPNESNIVREANRLCELFNSQWSHHLNEADVEALLQRDRLMDITHDWKPGEGWKRKEPAVRPTAQEVNLWSISGQGGGHDGINCWAVIHAELERLEQPSACAHCEGKGETWPSEQAREASDNWEASEPPSGEGYQLWETVTEGSPISPVSQTPKRLARWLSMNPRKSDAGVTFEQWLAFIEGPGWAPSFVGTDKGLVPGVAAAS